MSSSSSLRGHIEQLYFGPKISVGVINHKVPIRFSSNYIFRFFSSIFSSSSLRGHIDLLFNLLNSGPEMSDSAISQNVSAWFSSNYILRFFLPISSCPLMGHIQICQGLKIQMSETFWLAEPSGYRQQAWVFRKSYCTGNVPIQSNFSLLSDTPCGRER